MKSFGSCCYHWSMILLCLNNDVIKLLWIFLGFYYVDKVNTLFVRFLFLVCMNYFQLSFILMISLINDNTGSLVNSLFGVSISNPFPSFTSSFSSSSSVIVSMSSISSFLSHFSGAFSAVVSCGSSVFIFSDF